MKKPPKNIGGFEVTIMSLDLCTQIVLARKNTLLKLIKSTNKETKKSDKNNKS